MTVYIMGEVAALTDERRRISCRVHDECNGSDVFGSAICTCRPYLVHGPSRKCVKEARRAARRHRLQSQGGRALGEVTKFLVYNCEEAPGGRRPRPATYFERTECVAGVQDARFQQLMPDVLHWLGIRRIDRLMSMSNMKYDAIVSPASRSSSACRSRRSSSRPTPPSSSRPRRRRATTRRTAATTRRALPGSRDGI
jgi:GTP cyclohydrolase II